MRWRQGSTECSQILNKIRSQSESASNNPKSILINRHCSTYMISTRVPRARTATRANRKTAQTLSTFKLARTYSAKPPKNRQNTRLRPARPQNEARTTSKCERHNRSSSLVLIVANSVHSKRLQQCNDKWHASTVTYRHASWRSSCRIRIRVCTKELNRIIRNYKKIKLS